jgi:hypothetical protein
MASHTTTGEWKSFEVRMRRRRVERLLLRAEVAAAEGCLDEARACLDEARRLAPAAPEIQRMQRAIDAPPRSVAAPRSAPFTLRRAAPLTTAAALVAGALWGGVATRPRAIVPAADFRSVQIAPQAADSTPIHPPAAPRATEMPARATLDITVPDLVETGERRNAGVPVAPARISAPAVTPVSLTTLPRVPAAAARDLPPATSTGPASAEIAPDLPALSTGASAPAIDAPVPAPVAHNDETAVRGTLDRYAAAYNDLDAAAAERVWPRVNRTALSRAFESLASQQVTLGDCRIDVNGAVARASCAGSTTWAAKVGDGSPRTEPRRWTFDLARSGDAWQIVSARAQGR